VDFSDPTQASVNCSPDPVAAGTATTCTATVTDTASSPSTPTGTVSFSSTGSGSFSGSVSCSLSGSGASASCQLSYAQAAGGELTVSVGYSGDGQHSPSSGSTVLTVYQPLKGNGNCTGVSGGTGQNVTVPAGATCTLVAGTVVTGNVTDNGTLTLSGATIDGNLQSQDNDPAAVVTGNTVGG